MPCRVSSDVHEWTNDLPAVPAWGPGNPLYLDEQSRDTQRGEKSPWSFTAACRWDVIAGTECRGEPSKPGLRVRWRRECNTTYLRLHLLAGLTLELRQVGSLAWGELHRKNIEGDISTVTPRVSHGDVDNVQSEAL